jgi:hypothetical protein
MQRQLAAVPLARRRRAIAVLFLLALLLVVAGTLPWVRPAPASVRVIAVAALLSGLLGLLIAWGLATSVRLERRRATEAEIDSVLAAAGGGCDCGHEHGADAHPAPIAACADGADGVGGADSCPHTCEACLLSTLR